MLAYQKNGRQAYIHEKQGMYVILLSDDKHPGCYLESHEYPTMQQARQKGRDWCGIKAVAETY